MTRVPRALIAGWFSFEGAHATAGDLLARDLASRWLANAGFVCDLAVAPPFSGGVDWRHVPAADYAVVVFLCGPFGRRQWETEFLSHFQGRRLIGLNLSMLEPVDRWNPFELLLERDSTRRARPDVVFLTEGILPPVIGVCRVEPYEDALVDAANAAIDALVDSREMAVIEIDTRLDVLNAAGLRTPGEIEAAIARVDALITTRLHGTVLALKHGVPVLAIDPMGDGRKILRQCETVGWPVVFPADRLSPEALAEAFDFCLSQRARDEAMACKKRAIGMLHDIEQELVRAALSPSRDA